MSMLWTRTYLHDGVRLLSQITHGRTAMLLTDTVYILVYILRSHASSFSIRRMSG